MAYTDDSPLLLNELKTNAAVFAAFKNHVQSKELVSLLVDENGKKRSWTDFRKEAAKVDSKYNKQWLEAEFNYATRAARAANQWQEAQRTKDLYPNLEYLPSTAANPRTEHTLFYGIIKPIDDPFWDRNMPPNGWGCKCSVAKTREAASTSEFEPVEQIPGIPGNPGKARQIFTAEHPFVQVTNSLERFEIMQQLNELNKGQVDYTIVKVGTQKIKAHAKADPQDLISNVEFSVPLLQTYKKDIEIREHSYDKGVKNPEFKYSGVTGDAHRIQSDNLRRSISNAFDSKLKKNGQLNGYKKCFIGIDFNGKLTDTNIAGAAAQLYSKITSNKTVKFVILRMEDNAIRINSNKLTFEKLLNQMRKGLLS